MCFTSQQNAATKQSYPSRGASQKPATKKAAYVHRTPPHGPEIKLPTRVALLSLFWLSEPRSHELDGTSSFLRTRTHVDVEHHVALVKLLPEVDPRGHDGSHGGEVSVCLVSARKPTSPAP